MKVNFGCGWNKLDGYLNVDVDGVCKPDKIVDLNKLPYSFLKNESVDDAIFDNVLEHLTVELPLFVNEMKRIIKPNGTLKIIMPNCFFWKNRWAFLLGHFMAENGWHINHSFLLPPSWLSLYLRLSGFDVVFNRPKGLWGHFAISGADFSADLFLSEINLVARKRA